MSFRPDLPDVIRRARKAARLSQRDLAVRLGVHHSAVAAWETGSYQPDMPHRISLSAVLGIDFIEMLPGANGHIAVVTDPVLVAIVRLIEQEPPHLRGAVLRAIAMLLERRAGLATSDPPARRPRGKIAS
jgi:transcriptional regulator with XRE-family HTH domain